MTQTHQPQALFGEAPWLILSLVFMAMLTPTTACAQSSTTSKTRQVVLPEDVQAQLTRANAKRLSINETGMLVLVGWSALNITSGAAGWATTDGRWRAFHQMNLGWNIVNAVIGAYGYWDATSTNPSDFTLTKTIQANQSIKHALLFNAGLDLAYMATGGFLWEKGLNDQREQFVGFGQSLILQGAFLLAFDLTLFFLHDSHSNDLLMSLTPDQDGAWRLNLSGRF